MKAQRLATVAAVFFYFMGATACSWNILQECCASKAETHQHENTHSHDDHHDHSHEADGNHKTHHQEKENQKDQKKDKPELCCDSLMTSLTISFKQIHKIFLVGFHIFNEIQKSFFASRPRICQEDLSHSIRGRPLYKTLYSINAPPAHP